MGGQARGGSQPGERLKVETALSVTLGASSQTLSLQRIRPRDPGRSADQTRRLLGVPKVIAW